MSIYKNRYFLEPIKNSGGHRRPFKSGDLLEDSNGMLYTVIGNSKEWGTTHYKVLSSWDGSTNDYAENLLFDYFRHVEGD